MNGWDSEGQTENGGEKKKKQQQKENYLKY